MWNIESRGLAIVEFGYAGLSSPEFEWVVLENEGTSAINLQGHHFDDGITWTQPDSFWMEPGARVRLVKDASLFSNVPEPVFQWRTKERAAGN